MFGYFGIMIRKGGSSVSQASTAIIFTTVCIGCVGGLGGDALLPLFKLYVIKMRTFVENYHPEISFAKCAISTFPLYDLFPEALREFHPDYHNELFQEPQELSSRSYNDSDETNIIPDLDKGMGQISSSAAAPMLSTQPSLSNSSSQHLYSSAGSPLLSNQSPTSESVSPSSASSSVVTTPLPLLVTYPPLPHVNHQNNSFLSNPPATFSAISNSSSSLSVPSESSNPLFPTVSTPTSPLPSYFLFQALAASGISSKDSIFIIELLELFFPDLFTSSIGEIIAAWQGGDNSKMRQNESQNIADSWLEGLDAVLASVFGAHPHVKREPLRNLVPTIQWESLLPPDNSSPVSRVGEEDEENEESDWWTSLRSTSVRIYHRLRMWLLPDADRRNLGRGEAKLIGLTHCARGYLVDIIWRWGEGEAEELRKEIEEKKRQSYIFRPKTSPMDVLPPLLKLLMPS